MVESVTGNRPGVIVDTTVERLPSVPDEFYVAVDVDVSDCTDEELVFIQDYREATEKFLRSLAYAAKRQYGAAD